jgi:cytochrome d ubiquinol oxidase subunit I
MYIAGYMVTGFVMAGAYASCRLRGRWTRYERVAMTVPLTIASLAAPVQVLVGDWMARVISVDQPIKLAAFEGLYRTTRGTSEHVLGWYTNGQIKYGIEIPHLLSLLAFHSWNARVTGLESVPASQRPPINVTRFSFQTMVGIGTLLALLGVFYLFVRIRRRRLPLSKWFYWAVVVSGPAATVALIAGWVTTEVGRQPWVVSAAPRGRLSGSARRPAERPMAGTALGAIPARPAGASAADRRDRPTHRSDPRRDG